MLAQVMCVRGAHNVDGTYMAGRHRQSCAEPARHGRPLETRGARAAANEVRRVFVFVWDWRERRGPFSAISSRASQERERRSSRLESASQSKYQTARKRLVVTAVGTAAPRATVTARVRPQADQPARTTMTQSLALDCNILICSWFLLLPELFAARERESAGGTLKTIINTHVGNLALDQGTLPVQFGGLTYCHLLKRPSAAFHMTHATHVACATVLSRDRPTVL